MALSESLRRRWRGSAEGISQPGRPVTGAVIALTEMLLTGEFRKTMGTRSKATREA
jgi:hypothetical protein